jgi:hypothetical protein
MFGLFKKNVAVAQIVHKVANIAKATNDRHDSSSDEEAEVDDTPEVVK